MKGLIILTALIVNIHIITVCIYTDADNEDISRITGRLEQIILHMEIVK